MAYGDGHQGQVKKDIEALEAASKERQMKEAAARALSRYDEGFRAGIHKALLLLHSVRLQPDISSETRDVLARVSVEIEKERQC